MHYWKEAGIVPLVIWAQPGADHACFPIGSQFDRVDSPIQYPLAQHQYPLVQHRYPLVLHPWGTPGW